MLSVAETREPVPWIINWQWLQFHMYRWRFQTSWKTGKKSQKQKPITEMNHSSGKLTNRFLTFWEVWKLDCLRMTSCRYFPPWKVPTEPHRRKRTVKKINLHPELAHDVVSKKNNDVCHHGEFQPVTYSVEHDVVRSLLPNAWLYEPDVW